MGTLVRHVALVVPDLRAAESYYQALFDMEVIGREAVLSDGLWYTLPFDKGWDDAEASGIELNMLALRRDRFVLALFKGDAPQGRVPVIGLTMPTEDIARVRARLPKDAQISEMSPQSLEFCDGFPIAWQISAPGNEFRTSGDVADRWLEL